MASPSPAKHRDDSGRGIGVGPVHSQATLLQGPDVLVVVWWCSKSCQTPGTSQNSWENHGRFNPLKSLKPLVNSARQKMNMAHRNRKNVNGAIDLTFFLGAIFLYEIPERTQQVLHSGVLCTD